MFRSLLTHRPRDTLDVIVQVIQAFYYFVRWVMSNVSMRNLSMRGEYSSESSEDAPRRRQEKMLPSRGGLLHVVKECSSQVKCSCWELGRQVPREEFLFGRTLPVETRNASLLCWYGHPIFIRAVGGSAKVGEA